MMYVYLGDRLTRSDMRGERCHAILNVRGKCVRGRNGSMLVMFECGERAVVIGRLLRKVKDES